MSLYILKAEEERSIRKKLGNVGHQSYVVEDDEDDVDEINFAMQRTDKNPPPLPNSAPPISDEDEVDDSFDKGWCS